MLRSVATVLLVLGYAVQLGADHIGSRIKTGTITAGYATSLSGAIAVDGTGGFSVDATFESGTSEAVCQPCLAGDSISLASVITSAFLGTAQFRGKTYTFDFAEDPGGEIAIDAPSVVLPTVEGTDPQVVEVSSPFTVAGSSFLGLRAADGVVHNLSLSGSGTATARYSTFYDEVDQTRYYFFEEIRYEFANE